MANAKTNLILEGHDNGVPSSIANSTFNISCHDNWRITNWESETNLSLWYLYGNEIMQLVVSTVIHKKTIEWSGCKLQFHMKYPSLF